MSVHVCIHVNTHPHTQLLRTEQVEEGEGALWCFFWKRRSHFSFAAHLHCFPPSPLPSPPPSPTPHTPARTHTHMYPHTHVIGKKAGVWWTVFLASPLRDPIGGERKLFTEVTIHHSDGKEHTRTHTHTCDRKESRGMIDSFPCLSPSWSSLGREKTIYRSNYPSLRW